MTAAISTPVFVSGTGQQISADAIAVVSPFITASGTVSVDLSADGTNYTNLNPTAPVSIEHNYPPVTVPAGWYVRFNLTGATMVATATTLS
jgi:hypothetical protein